MMNNFELMRKRLEFQGGIAQDERMIKGKWWSFQRALKYSYQGCDVTMVQPHDTCLSANPYETDDFITLYPLYRALINPNKVKQDYDDKIISIDYNTGFGPGDVFQWMGETYHYNEGEELRNQDSYWIIYLEELTEDGYFRGDIRRCKYQIKFRDEEGNFLSTWASIRGPVETQIDSIQKNQIRVDRPNLSLNILMPRNEKTLKAFDRYKEFIFAGKCWRVEALDSISMTNVIEVNAEEYFIDKDTDNVEEEMKNGLIIEPIDPTPNSGIIGETFIKPKIAEIYTAPESGGRWCIVEGKAPVKLKLKTDTKVEAIWDKTTKGEFTLRWTKDDKQLLKTIIVESLL